MIFLIIFFDPHHTAKDLHYKNLSKYKKYSPGLCFYPALPFCQLMKRAMHHYMWDWVIGLIVVINTFIIIVEADLDASLPNGSTETPGLVICEALNMIFGTKFLLLSPVQPILIDGFPL